MFLSNLAGEVGRELSSEVSMRYEYMYVLVLYRIWLEFFSVGSLVVVACSRLVLCVVASDLTILEVLHDDANARFSVVCMLLCLGDYFYPIAWIWERPGCEICFLRRGVGCWASASTSLMWVVLALC